jgi:hypothetical protein
MGGKGQLMNPVVDPSEEYVLHDDTTVRFLMCTLKGQYGVLISILHD